MRIIITIAAVASLAGCSAYSNAPAAEAGTPPTNYKAAVTQSVRQTFFDPYSVRDASISSPFYASAVFDGGLAPKRGWVVCVRANAKNRMGAYIGLQPSMFLFQGDSVVTTLSGPDFVYQVENACKTAAYQAYPEIEGRG